MSQPAASLGPLAARSRGAAAGLACGVAARRACGAAGLSSGSVNWSGAGVARSRDTGVPPVFAPDTTVRRPASPVTGELFGCTAASGVPVVIAGALPGSGVERGALLPCPFVVFGVDAGRLWGSLLLLAGVDSADEEPASSDWPVCSRLTGG